MTGPSGIPVGRVAVAADPFGNILAPLDLSKGRYVTGTTGKRHRGSALAGDAAALFCHDGCLLQLPEGKGVLHGQGMMTLTELASVPSDPH